MTLRAFRASVASPRLAAFVALGTLGAGALVAALPTFGIQVAIILAAAVSAACLIMLRAGRVLNPVWVIVVLLYLLGPVGNLLSRAGILLPMAAVAILALCPFVVGALMAQRHARDGLVTLTPLALLLVLAGLSLLWSPVPSIGLEKLTTWIATGLLPAAFIVVLGSASRRVAWEFVVIAALASAAALIAFGTAAPLYPGRPTVFDANPIEAARALFIGALVALYSPIPVAAKLVTAAVMVVAGLATASLGPALGFLLGAGAGAAEALRRSGRSARGAALGWAAFVCASGFALLASLTSAFDVGAGNPALAGVINDPNVTSRATFLGAAASMLIKAPVLGVGLGGFATAGLLPYPHNLIAEIGAELGSIGLLALLTWFGFALRGAARSPLLVALVVATGVFALFSGSIASNAEFWMCSALAVVKVRPEFDEPGAPVGGQS
jgi:O-antigen ligase